jgi:hypothetical protein
MRHIRYVSHNTPVLPSSLYLQQLKERLGDEAATILPQIFFPSQLAGEFKHPTALWEDQFVISGLNTRETSATFDSSYALSLYHGDPWSSSSATGQPASWLSYFFTHVNNSVLH